ncbi:hypothetical protein [Rasiella sp. SM2506]|uniref:hypothetical protein n=1 Tax=Rasiella sp. SM2506 TaxID=3423914 RepID=UPI003D7BFA3B
MKKIGLWIQNKKAIVVIIKNAKINIHQVNDKSRELPKITHPFVFRNSHKIIPQNINICLQPRVVHFAHIINYLSGAKRILIVGPDDTSEFFYKHLRKTNKSICDSVCNVKHMDHMPDPKIANYFINFFSIKNEKGEPSSY